MDDLLQDITIYHNKTRYNIMASVRNTEGLTRNKNGDNKTASSTIRIFDYEDIEVSNGDVIYLGYSDYDIVDAPKTELIKKYGKENVVEVQSIDRLIFSNSRVDMLSHIKIGAV